MYRSNDKTQGSKLCTEKQSNDRGTQLGVKSERNDWKNSQSMSWRTGVEGWTHGIYHSSLKSGDQGHLCQSRLQHDLDSGGGDTCGQNLYLTLELCSSSRIQLHQCMR